jgi:hypothetical protein
LYQIPAFGAFHDFSDFVESVSCETSESCQVPWFGEPQLPAWAPNWTNFQLWLDNRSWPFRNVK